MDTSSRRVTSSYETESPHTRLVPGGGGRLDVSNCYSSQDLPRRTVRTESVQSYHQRKSAGFYGVNSNEKTALGFKAKIRNYTNHFYSHKTGNEKQ